MKKIPVGILGATGIIGQHYVQRLVNHPWFELTFLAASQSGDYADRVRGKWSWETSPPHFPVQALSDLDHAKKTCRLVFSALPNEQAASFEPLYASEGFAVISNASYHRGCNDVPLLIPEVNSSHLTILPMQQKKRGWGKGFIVTKPNCSLQSFVIPLTPLHTAFGIETLLITTLQAISGAGHAGLPSHMIQDNVIPFIEGEEQKTESEPLKIWGRVDGQEIIPLTTIKISTHCNRVPVLEGHMACVSVRFKTKPSIEQILTCWQTFRSPFSLPSSPEHLIVYHHEQTRPQTRLDRLLGNGMSINMGRLRPCNIFDVRFVGLSHNAIRGGAGGGILNAELLYYLGYL